ncbi:MEF2 [Candida theae]|uniref:Ribosome-releasing factor 2, mitochondrial n=1 Tax=Candida theae TaxID=1198502 RepID=A0AAD5FYI8_9ASCO|nr:MEF2 [Candida theae]KAI5958112.1 MEF2 [Candida theae]
MILRHKLLHQAFSIRLHSTVSNVALSKIRNIGIIAHIDAGKTTTTERMIYYSGKSSRIGNVDEGDTVTDYLRSERERGITIQSAATTIPWNQHKINIIDTPGHADFTFEVVRSLRVLDGAVTILDAVAGVEAQTEKVWKQASVLGLPRVIYINKMDRPGAGFSRTVREVIQKLETRVVLCNIPYFEVGADQEYIFKGVIDVLHGKLLKWKEEDKFGKEIDVFDLGESKPELFEMYSKARESMVETLGEIDESVIDAFLENDEDYLKISPELLDSVIRKATLSNFLAPVFCGSSFRNIGVQPLMDGISKYLPSPLQTTLPDIKSKKKEISKKMDDTRGLIFNNDKNLTVGLVFKVMTHATRGPMTFVRVYSGKLNASTNLINTRTGKKLLVRNLLVMHGDAPEEVKSVSAGDIGVIPGYETEFKTGDTFVCSAVGKKAMGPMESNMTLMPIDIPPPLFNASIEPHTAGDEAYMRKCLDILVREDPSLKVHVDEELGQTVLSGMGELHLDIVRERLINDMKAKVNLRDVAVSFKESFVGRTEAEGSFEAENTAVKLIVGHVENCTDFESVPGAHVFEDENNVIILPDSAASEHAKTALSDRRWKCPNSIEDLKEAVINGCLTSLQMGGPQLGLSLHSTVITIDHWDAPVDKGEELVSSLMNASRQAIQSVKEEVSNFAIFEPVMITKVYVNSNDLGEVSHDLTQRCQAVILAVEDESTQDSEIADWTSEVAEKTYVPPDYTLSRAKGKSADFANKKIIIAETPLKEMIGYLSKLRALTQGRATFDMSFIGMRRAVGSRADSIARG